MVTNGELQLSDQDPGSNNTSFLYLPAATSLDETTTWQFMVRMDFSPSSSNFTTVYLAASDPDLEAPQNGYYLKIGGISGGNDAVELFRQDGNSSTLLISGTVGAVGAQPAMASIQVTRSEAGLWTLSADYSGGQNYQEEGSITDDTHPLGNFFGFVCHYTSTRNEAFFFDNVLIDPLFVDMAAPELVSAEAISATLVELNFNEPLDENAATTAANYSIDNGIGTPAEAVLLPGNPSVVRLTLGTPLTNTQTYSISANNVADANGNVASDLSASFTFFDFSIPETNDIIITEIMADPNPRVGLPETEYIELFNRSEKVFQLKDYGFSTGSTTRSLPEMIMLPGSYIIITASDKVDEFPEGISIIGLSSFPALTNSAGDLFLFDENGSTIHEISYFDEWYRDGTKMDGGWSLELIRTNGPYNCEGNWAASLDSRGGSPGKENTLPESQVDAAPPLLNNVIAESETEVLVSFSDAMTEVDATNPDNYSLSNGITIQDVFNQSNGSRQVLLLLSSPLQQATIYTLTVSRQVSDCIGNQLGSNSSRQFGLSEAIEVGDLAVNEILFNPQTGGEDFVELYNRSEKILNVNGLEIRNWRKESGNFRQQIEQDFLLLPGNYLALTADPEDIKGRYVIQDPEAFLQQKTAHPGR